MKEQMKELQRLKGVGEVLAALGRIKLRHDCQGCRCRKKGVRENSGDEPTKGSGYHSPSQEDDGGS